VKSRLADERAEAKAQEALLTEAAAKAAKK